eukprot:361889-Chlamydomonas_euryale.AAC.5
MRVEGAGYGKRVPNPGHLGPNLCGAAHFAHGLHKRAPHKCEPHKSGPRQCAPITTTKLHSLLFSAHRTEQQFLHICTLVKAGSRQAPSRPSSSATTRCRASTSPSWTASIWWCERASTPCHVRHALAGCAQPCCHSRQLRTMQMTHYRGKSGDLKFKPGYVSDREDAVMEIQVCYCRRCGQSAVNPRPVNPAGPVCAGSPNTNTLDVHNRLKLSSRLSGLDEGTPG